MGQQDIPFIIIVTRVSDIAQLFKTIRLCLSKEVNMVKSIINSRNRMGIRNKCSELKGRIKEIEMKKYSLVLELANLQRKCLHPKACEFRINGEKRRCCPDCGLDVPA
jgi:hypothetical protein